MKKKITLLIVWLIAAIPYIYAQQLTITGTVTDNALNEPIIGASVVVEGTTNGMVTDLDGHFSLEVSPGNVLNISYIGYKPQSIRIDGRQLFFQIALMEDSQTLDEVVVVGYGTQKKVNLTGSVETVKGDILENRPVRSVTDALQGTVAGLTVQSADGTPGNASTFQIRGATSINSSGALVIIDGMPGEINRINPQDIESISILKDAASAAIYGARAAEGVVLITTKKGSTDKVKIEYSGNVSHNTPTRIPKSTNSLQHALLSNTAFENAGLAVLFPQNAIEAIKDPNTIAIPNGNDWIYTDDVDWIGMMFDNQFQQTHNLTISRAAEKVNYLISGNWLDQNGFFAEYGPDNFDMINLRSNLDVVLIPEKMSLDSRISFSNSSKKYHPQFGADANGNGGWTIPYITFIQAGPNMPIYDPNGNYSRYRMQGNPIQALQEVEKENKKYNALTEFSP